MDTNYKIRCIFCGAEFPTQIRPKIHIQNIKDDFEMRYYGEYNDTNQHPHRDTETEIMTWPNKRVSARKIGDYVKELGINKDRDGRGIYIPFLDELAKIEALSERYGLTIPWRQPASGVTDPQPKLPIDDSQKGIISADDIPFD